MGAQRQESILNLALSALEARAVHDTLSYLLRPQRVQDDPDTAELRRAMEKIRRYADEAFCSQERCDRPTYAKGLCEPCYRATRRKRRRSLQNQSEVA